MSMAGKTSQRLLKVMSRFEFLVANGIVGRTSPSLRILSVFSVDSVVTVWEPGTTEPTGTKLEKTAAVSHLCLACVCVYATVGRISFVWVRCFSPSTGNLEPRRKRSCVASCPFLFVCFACFVVAFARRDCSTYQLRRKTTTKTHETHQTTQKEKSAPNITTDTKAHEERTSHVLVTPKVTPSAPFGDLGNH